jgi:hypothetical protein
MPLSILPNIQTLEDSIPSKIKSATIELGISLNPMATPKPLSSTGLLIPKVGSRAAEPRMTSSAIRAERNQKRDIEEMV